jgi:hypothetical protein
MCSLFFSNVERETMNNRSRIIGSTTSYTPTPLAGNPYARSVRIREATKLAYKKAERLFWSWMGVCTVGSIVGSTAASYFHWTDKAVGSCLILIFVSFVASAFIAMARYDRQVKRIHEQP